MIGSTLFMFVLYILSSFEFSEPYGPRKETVFPGLISIFFAWLNYRFSIAGHPLKFALTSRNGVSLSTTHLTGQRSKTWLLSLTATYCASTRCQAEAVCFS